MEQTPCWVGLSRCWRFCRIDYWCENSRGEDEKKNKEKKKEGWLFSARCGVGVRVRIACWSRVGVCVRGSGLDDDASTKQSVGSRSMLTDCMEVLEAHAMAV